MHASRSNLPSGSSCWIAAGSCMPAIAARCLIIRKRWVRSWASRSGEHKRKTRQLLAGGSLRSAGSAGLPVDIDADAVGVVDAAGVRSLNPAIVVIPFEIDVGETGHRAVDDVQLRSQMPLLEACQLC